jgi:hypothetical protein
MARQRDPGGTGHGKSDHWVSRLPAPDAQEGGESAWQLWQEASLRLDLAFAPTEPSDLVALTSTGGGIPEVLPIEARSHLLNANALMVIARRNNRVCPRAPHWSALYDLLEGERHKDLLAPPVQPWLWVHLSGLQKRLRFREHVEWAERHGRLGVVARFMGGLQEGDWVHMGESDPR